MPYYILLFFYPDLISPSMKAKSCVRYAVCAVPHTVTLSGSGQEQFTGFLVQARTVADGSPVGVFTDNTNDQTLSSCSPSEVIN